MFENKYEYLVHLVCCALHNQQPSEKPDTISFEDVFEAGKVHEVANIAFVSVEKLSNKPDDELYKKWKIQYAFSIQRNINQMSARDTIVDALNKHGIRNIELQGTVIKKLYPYEFWRNMSDIDFVIDKQNLLKAEKVMQGLGYKTNTYGDYDISAYANPKIAVELHSDFFDPNTEFYTKMTNPFEKAVPSSNAMLYIANDADVFLYNILHCIKHYYNCGAGIRRILDVYYLNNFLLPRLDKQNVFDFLVSLDCKQDYDVLSAIAEEWFGKNDSKCDYHNIKNIIYASGTHGSIVASMLRDKENNKKLLKFRRVLLLMFPKKEAIYSAYNFCAKHKLPLLLCWIYRWGCLLFIRERRKRAVNIITDIKHIKLK